MTERNANASETKAEQQAKLQKNTVYRLGANPADVAHAAVWTPPPPSKGQLELPIGREVVRDRNADRGGRSFYFFDFDDNVAFLATPIILFEKDTGRELRVSSGEYAQIHRNVGKPGAYENYEMINDDRVGSFRCFRDRDMTTLERLLGKKQMFVQDLAAALGYPDVQWKGPSWSCFYHAALNQRPMSVITARGHSPETIKQGIRLFVDREYLPAEPNYLSIFPVTNPGVREQLGCADGSTSVAALKRAAIRESVERAVQVYGKSDYHRFGMSDDDPHNIELITEEMKALKMKYPSMSFFVIETQAGRFVKWEVYPDHTEATLCSANTDFQSFEQLTLLPR
ncbi:MAG: hypothetical protein RBT63_02285 [Bdellovibrionales bacterium]|jgi:hypothetical protein|nr:hypothetical protein [Bdellovibrionales bacterium]